MNNIDNNKTSNINIDIEEIIQKELAKVALQFKEENGRIKVSLDEKQDISKAIEAEVKWIKQRGYASESKKRDIRKQIEETYGLRTDKELEEIDKALKKLAVVSDEEDKKGTSRVQEISRQLEKVIKKQQEIKKDAEEIGQKKAKRGKGHQPAVESVKKLIKKAELSSLKTKGEIKEFREFTPPVAQARHTKDTQDDIQALFKKNLSKDFDKKSRDEWKGKAFAWDTETTKASKNGAGYPVTLALAYYKKQNGEFIKEAKQFYLNYSSKTNDYNVKTAAYLIKAMNAYENGVLLESSVQLRKNLEFKGAEVTPEFIESVWDEKIKPSLVTPEELASKFKALKVEGDSLYGYNNRYDIKAVGKWLKAFGGTDSDNVKYLQNILKRSSQNDLMSIALATGGHNNNILKASRAKNSLIGGILKLQSLVGLMSGSGTSSSKAHEAADDAMQTLELADLHAHENFFNALYTALSSGAERFKGQRLQKDEKFFTEEYKSHMLETMAALTGEASVGKVDYRYSNQHLADKFKALGLNSVGALATSEYSVDALKDKIKAAYAERGIGVKFYGNKVGLYALKSDGSVPSLDNMAVVEMAQLDDAGALRRGRQSVANITYLDYLFKGKGKAPQAVIYSGYEAQYKHLLDIAGYKTTSDGEIIDSAIVQALKNGELERASNIAEIGVSSVLKGSPTGTTAAARNEIDDMFSGFKTPEQMIMNQGLFSTQLLAENFFRYYAEEIQKIYDANPNSWGQANKLDPNKLTNHEYATIARIYSAVATGNKDNVKFGNDKLANAILTDEKFSGFRRTIETFAKYGLIPEFASGKEEAFLNGLFSVSGAKDVLPLAIWGDRGDRALHQVLKYNERKERNPGKKFGESVFASEVGRNLGVDYTKAELSQYLSSGISDTELSEAVKNLDEGLRNQYKDQLLTASVGEGGLIMSESMAKELTSYRKTSLTMSAGKMAKFLTDSLGMDPSYLEDLKDGDMYEFNNENAEGLLKRSFKIGETSLDKGDIISGFEKIGDEYKLIYKKLEEVRTGSKILGSDGGRYTARVLNDNLYNAIINQMGKSGAQFLHEKVGYAPRKIMPNIRGRLSYLIGAGLNNGQSIQKVLDAARKNLTIAKGWSILDGKIVDSSYYDDIAGDYFYLDKNGKAQKLFDTTGTNLTREELIKQALVENSGENSQIAAFGKALLGEDEYEATKHLYSQFFNMMDEVPYFNPVGSADIDTLDKKGRVKFGDRERRAFRRRLGLQNGIDGLDVYQKSEEALISAESERSKKAKEVIRQIDKSLTGVIGKEKPLKVVYKEDQSTVNEADEFNLFGLDPQISWNNGGLSKEEYSETIMAKIRKKAGERGIAISFGRNERFLADMVAEPGKDGKYMPTNTDIINNRLFSAIINSRGDSEAVEKAFERTFGIDQYDKSSAYYKMAHDTSGSLYKAANEVYVGNSAYGRAIGAINSRIDKNNANTIWITQTQMMRQLASDRGANELEIAANVERLKWLAEAQEFQDDTDIQKSYADFEKAANDINTSKKTLREKEDAFIKTLTGQLKKENKTVLGQLHRYPSTSGLDIKHVNIGITDNKNVAEDAITLSQGLSATINADYDGDKLWQRILFANNNYGSQENFNKAYSAAKQITELDSAIALDMQHWAEANNDKPKSGEEVQKDIEDYAKSISKVDQQALLAIFSKSNKEYIGSFSNMATNVRNFMQDTGRDETAMSLEEASDAMIFRAYLEGLEQEAISAKKVAARLHSSGRTDEVMPQLDELQKLIDLMHVGDFTGVLTQSQNMNLGIESGRQMAHVMSVIKNSNEALYNAKYKEIFEGQDKGKTKTFINSIIGKFVKNFEKDDWRNILFNTRDRQYFIQKYLRAINTGLFTPDEAAKFASATTQDDLEKNALQELAKIEEWDKAEFIPMKASNQKGVNYDVYHMRELEDGNKRIRDTINKRTGQIDRQISSVTGLFQARKQEMSFADKQRGLIAAAKGTYAHKIAELMGKYGVEDYTALEGKLDSKEKEELNVALRSIGDAGGTTTPEALSELKLRAQMQYQAALSSGFFNEGLTESEKKLNFQGKSPFGVKREKLYGGQIGNKYIAGQADLVNVSSDKGIQVLDYKFSQDDSEETLYQRIAQASIYAYLEEQDLLAQKSKYKEDSGEAKAIQKAIDAGKKVTIQRSFVDREGNAQLETTTANAIESGAIKRILGSSLEAEEIVNKIKVITDKEKAGTANEEDRTNKEALMEKLSSTPLFTELINYGDLDIRTSSTGENIGAKISKKTQEYLSQQRNINKAQERLRRAEIGLSGKSGAELKAQQEYVRATQQEVNFLEARQIKFDAQEGTLDGIKLTENEINYILQGRLKLDAQHQSALAKINTATKQSQSLLSKMVGGFKQQVLYFLDYSLAYQAVGYIKRGISTLIEVTKQLDSAMVDIQIATGKTRIETIDLMLTYSDLARELGRTTQTVAIASNDWLRAGYEGAEAAKLTEASMMLSTLGMIEAGEATTYLISTLKGWKISADEVVGVVDKLTVTTCGVCLAIGIGHKFKCR